MPASEKDTHRALAAHRERCAAFRWDVPETFNFGRDVVDRFAAADPERPALLWRNAAGDERRLRYGEVRTESNRVAGLLGQLGVQPGDPVIIMLPRVPEWHTAMLGALKAGALVIPCSTILRPKDIAYRANHSRAVAVIAAVECAPAVDAVRPEFETLQHFLALSAPGSAAPEGWRDFAEASAEQDGESPPQITTRAADPALVYYTSGTTGPPKAVLHTHAYTWSQRVTAEVWLGLREGERIWTTSDTGWAKAAYSVLFGPFSVGAEVFLLHAPFDAQRELAVLQDIQPHVFCAPPTEFRLLVKQDLSRLQLPKLREVVSAGEPLNPEVIRAWSDATGLTIRDGYGQTETILLVGNFPGIPVRPGSMGLPTPGHQVEIIDDSGSTLAPGEVGDVAIRAGTTPPPSLFREYWKDPDATQKCRNGDWYVTGDRAYRDPDGYFWFVGRADDVIISAGYRIGPFEVESALIEHPSVLEAAAVAAPHPDRGSIVKAFVVLSPGTAASDALVTELQDHVKKVTAPYKYPRAIEFVAELPKTVSGKIRRIELRTTR